MLLKRRYFRRQTSQVSQDWRTYQQLLKRKRNIRQRSQRLRQVLIKAIGWGLALGVLAGSGLYLYDWLVNRVDILRAAVPAARQAASAAAPELLSFPDVQKIVADQHFLNRTTSRMTVTQGADQWDIQTSLMPELQQDLLAYLERKHARYIGIVAMTPEGRLLAMVGYDRTGTIDNVCTFGGYPAASLFKIVTAAAAIEKLGLKTTTPMAFNGNKYTLYKSQLTKKRNRYTHVMPFADAFAQSVNPVFGKLGALQLGKDALTRYADLFGFNQAMQFEKAVAPSQFVISDRSYQWAEIASGFNRTTTISPLHAALIAAIPLNQGRLATATVVDRIHSQSGTLRYQRDTPPGQQVVGPETSQTLQRLMQTTIRKGTARRAFRRLNRDKVLTDKTLGGKTGSIYNTTHDAKIDWFAGYARPKNGNRGVVVAIMVAHEKFIGRRAAQYARYLFKRYYQLQSQVQTDTVYSG